MAVNGDDILTQARRFLCNELGYTPEEIADGTPLFTSGLVDSFTFVGMVSLVELRLGRTLDPEEVTIENFDSLRRIAHFVERAAA